MIIKYPTGLYKTVLPKYPEDSQSVVYTISNSTPPRSSLNFAAVPFGIESRVRVRDLTPDLIRRSNLGQLVFVTKDERSGTIQTGNQLFYVGQVIEFGDVDAGTLVPLNTSVQTQHDLHDVDGSSVGIAEDGMADVAASADIAQRQILVVMGQLQKRKGLLDIEVLSQQCIINEANRVLAGLEVVLKEYPTAEILKIKQQVQAKKDAATESLDAILEELQSLPAQITQKKDELTALAILVK